MNISLTHISSWGNGLALRLTKPVAKTAGITKGTPVRIVVQPGRIVIETKAEPTLEQMLARFDPQKHGGELLADCALGVEVFS